MTESEQAARALDADFQTVFQTDAGNRVMSHLGDYVGAKRPVFRRGQEPWEPQYLEGMRSLFWYIESVINKPQNRQQTPIIKK